MKQRGRESCIKRANLEQHREVILYYICIKHVMKKSVGVLDTGRGGDTEREELEVK